jgi:glyoxalase family protein
MRYIVCTGSYLGGGGAMRLEGIHHVTAITGDAPRNVDFYTRVLGLRLVAKTVNQDDPSVYHLFYADEEGTPGGDITFFEYPGSQPGRAGAGMVHRVVSRVASPEALDFWAARLADEGVPAERTGSSLIFADPEGLAHELIVSGADESLVARPLDGEAWELRGERRGGTIRFDPAPPERGRSGAGTVHHVAWGSSVADHPRWEERLQAAGVRTSGIIDRHYFRSIYFREPGGVLYEIADYGPGFTRDLPLEELGTRVILPPWLEPNRAEVEAVLTPLPDPRAAWAASTPAEPAVGADEGVLTSRG